MRKQLAKFGAMIMVAVILTAILSVDAKSETETLVLEIDFNNQIFNFPGNTRDLEKGVRTYQEWGLRDAQGVDIGIYRFHAVSTQPANVDFTAWYGNESFEIFGEGVIEGISQADLSVGLFPVGAIIGGTGRFAGASGEYSGVNLSIYTFTIHSDEDDDSDSDSDSD